MDILEHDKSPFLLKEIHLATEHWRCNSIAVANNGTMIAFGKPGLCTNDVLVIDTVIGSKIRTIHVENGVYSASITPDGSKVVIGDADDNMTIWDISKLGSTIPPPVRGEGGFKRHDGAIFSNYGNKAFLMNRKGCDCVMDLNSGITWSDVVLDFGPQHYCSALSSDDEVFAVASTDSIGVTIITLIDAKNGDQLAAFKVEHSVYDLSNTVKPHEFYFNMDRSCTWDYDSNIITAGHISERYNSPTSYILSRDQRKVALKYRGRFLILSDFDGQDAILNYRGEEYNYALSGDGSVLWTRDQYTIRMYDTDTSPFWTCLNHLRFKEETKEAIKTLFIANRTLYRRGSADGVPFALLPREICLHVFSFIRREQ